MPRVSLLVVVMVVVVLMALVCRVDMKQYDGHCVFRVKPNSSSQVVLLQQIQRQYQELDFWTHPTATLKPVDVMVPPELQKNLTKALDDQRVPYSTFINDVQTLIDTDLASRARTTGFNWKNYYPLENVYSWMDSLVKKYPRVVSPLVIGKSFEGRQLRGVKISYRRGNPAIFIESGTHAREWITVATSTFIVNELLTNNDATIRGLAKSFDWYVVPTANPDGYVYSHNWDRMWRKTRSILPNSDCKGSDANRNWDYFWKDAAANKKSCSPIYSGPSPFWEKEARSLSEFLKTISCDLEVYLSLHSYSQLLMFPYGLTYERADNYDELLEIARKGVVAGKQRYGTEYKCGSIHNVTYSVSGCSVDWVKKCLGTRFVYIWELRDQGDYGFLLPAEQIVPTALETIDILVATLQEVQARTAAGGRWKHRSRHCRKFKCGKQTNVYQSHYQRVIG